MNAFQTLHLQLATIIHPQADKARPLDTSFVRGGKNSEINRDPHIQSFLRPAVTQDSAVFPYGPYNSNKPLPAILFPLFSPSFLSPHLVSWISAFTIRFQVQADFLVYEGTSYKKFHSFLTPLRYFGPFRPKVHFL
ncbi:hypothetical protein TWF569_003946 [Orbilia oligospora]|uniref:Uncharacterized protein n=1 Tax=Orbilia oligospora TaxID=2813651 RepID=A0A7C8JFF8_ORBOL|nr:hypothetical protein TWF102_005352 [Orbilia oligospora]KAF3114125.1 hypothetical protein TWF103_001552 [Orbilia oligospora]KAF3157029.1 hypothetical protein TWF569_003946 [Orbilia oligospora]